MSISNILIIEEDELFASALEQALSSAGHFCILVGDNSKAMPYLSTSMINLILLDIRSHSATGYEEVLKELQKMNPSTPVIVISDLAELVTSDHVQKLGARDVVAKANIDLEEVVALVAQHLVTTS